MRNIITQRFSALTVVRCMTTFCLKSLQDPEVRSVKARLLVACRAVLTVKLISEQKRCSVPVEQKPHREAAGRGEMDPRGDRERPPSRRSSPRRSSPRSSSRRSSSSRRLERLGGVTERLGERVGDRLWQLATGSRTNTHSIRAAKHPLTRAAGRWAAYQVVGCLLRPAAACPLWWLPCSMRC